MRKDSDAGLAAEPLLRMHLFATFEGGETVDGAAGSIGGTFDAKLILGLSSDSI